MTKIYRAIKTDENSACFEDYDKDNPDDSERTSAITGTFKGVGFNNKEVVKRTDSKNAKAGDPMVIREVYVNLLNKKGEELVIKGAISFHYPKVDKTTINYTVMGMLNQIANYKELGKLEFTITKKKNAYINIIARKSGGQDNPLFEKFTYEQQQEMTANGEDVLGMLENLAKQTQPIKVEETNEPEPLTEQEKADQIEVDKDQRFGEDVKDEPLDTGLPF